MSFKYLQKVIEDRINEEYAFSVRIHFGIVNSVLHLKGFNLFNFN